MQTITFKGYLKKVGNSFAHCYFNLRKKHIVIKFYTRCGNVAEDKEKILKFLELCLDKYINEVKPSKHYLTIVEGGKSTMDEETKKRITIKTDDVLFYEGQEKKFKTIFHEYFYYFKKAFWD